MDFLRTFDASASWDEDEPRFLDQKVKVQGHSVTKCAKNSIFGVCFPDISSRCRHTELGAVVFSPSSWDMLR